MVIAHCVAQFEVGATKTEMQNGGQWEIRSRSIFLIHFRNFVEEPAECNKAHKLNIRCFNRRKEKHTSLSAKMWFGIVVNCCYFVFLS